MAISERINSDNLNIHQFQELPEARSKAPFDPERDIDPDTKQEILKSIKEINDAEEGPFNVLTEKIMIIIEAVRNYRILWPNESIKTLPESDPIQDWEIIKQLPEPGSKIKYLYSLKITRPDLVVATPDEWLNLVEEVGEFDSQDGDSINTYAKIITIDLHAQSLTQEKILELVEGVNKEVKNMPIAAMDENNAIFAASVLANVRLIDSSYVPPLSQDDWVMLHSTLEKYKAGNDWITYNNLAADLKIIVAYKVTVTAPGVINIQMYPPEDVNTQTLPIPEQRKF